MPEDIQRAFSSKGCHGPLCLGWSFPGSFAGRSSPVPIRHLFSQVSREEVGPVSVSPQSTTTDSILYASAKLQLSREDTAVGHDFVGSTALCGC